MSHHIYSTPALVLKSEAVREHDRIFSLLTQDLGLVYVVAQGIRKETSKLRGMMLDGALVHASLVRGRHIWRLTTASLAEDVFRNLKTKKEIQKSYAQILALVSRLVHGEEKHPEIFSVLQDAARAGTMLEKDESEGFEITVVSKLLFHLGYLAPKDVPERIISDPLSRELFAEALKDKKRIVMAINSGLRESGLNN